MNNPTNQGPSDHRPEETADIDRIPKREKIVYGLGSPALGFVDQIILYQVQQVMVYGLGLSPALNSIMIMVYRIVDALTDPIVGWISDNTRSRFGRRRPFMLVGCFFMALLMPLVWRFDETWNHFWIATWFITFGVLVSTATTLFNIPYQSLRMEMTPDYNERTSIAMYVGIIGTIFGLISPWVWKLTQQPFFTGQLPGEAPNTLLGIRGISIWFAGLVLIIGLIPSLLCRERYYEKAKNQKKEPILKSLRLTFRSKPFLMMLAFIFTMNLEGLVLGMGGYISLYYVFGGDKVFAATFAGVAGTIGGLLGFFSIPFFGKLAGRFGKERALLVVTCAHMVMAASIWLCYQPKYPWLAILPGLLNGILIGGLWTVVPSMKADIVDDDEVNTGDRREGSFESIFSWFQKFTGTIFTGLSGILVVLVGFKVELGSAQADGVFTRMILLMSVIPLLLGLMQVYLIIKWPLSAGRMREIRAVIEARRGKIDMNSGGLSRS